MLAGQYQINLNIREKLQHPVISSRGDTAEGYKKGKQVLLDKCSPYPPTDSPVLTQRFRNHCTVGPSWSKGVYDTSAQCPPTEAPTNVVGARLRTTASRT